jgi:hypothetical protein
MRRTNRQLTTLAPALLGGPVHVGVQTDVGRVDAVARRFGGATYVFAVNVSRQPVHARFSVARGNWQVFEEARVVRGVLADSFAPLGVHVYVLPPAAFR